MTKLIRRHVYEHPDMIGRPPATVVLCNGAGVDSMALLHLWCHNPTSRDFDLDELLVITAITGDEYRSTIEAANVGNPGYQNMRSSSRSIPPISFPAQHVPAHSERPTLRSAPRAGCARICVSDSPSSIAVNLMVPKADQRGTPAAPARTYELTGRIGAVSEPLLCAVVHLPARPSSTAAVTSSCPATRAPRRAGQRPPQEHMRACD